MEREEKLLRIAKHYGFENQSRQCVEEMAELTKEICKYHRTDSPIEKLHALHGMVEELADVEAMIRQLKMLLDAESVDYTLDKKLDRQLERIREESTY